MEIEIQVNETTNRQMRFSALSNTPVWLPFVRWHNKWNSRNSRLNSQCRVINGTLVSRLILSSCWTGWHRDERLIATLIAPETFYGWCLLTRVYTRAKTRNVCYDTCGNARLTLVHTSHMSCASSIDLSGTNYASL